MTQSDGRTSRNPYSGIGDVVRDYGRNLNAAMRQLKNVEKQMKDDTTASDAMFDQLQDAVNDAGASSRAATQLASNMTSADSASSSSSSDRATGSSSWDSPFPATSPDPSDASSPAWVDPHLNEQCGCATFTPEANAQYYSPYIDRVCALPECRHYEKNHPEYKERMKNSLWGRW
jgi:hypothetical protein